MSPYKNPWAVLWWKVTSGTGETFPAFGIYSDTLVPRGSMSQIRDNFSWNAQGVKYPLVTVVESVIQLFFWSFFFLWFPSLWNSPCLSSMWWRMVYFWKCYWLFFWLLHLFACEILLFFLIIFGEFNIPPHFIFPYLSLEETVPTVWQFQFRQSLN